MIEHRDAAAKAARVSGPSVSIILCNYNDARFLPDSLTAICSQTRAPDEVILLDDGSTDDSLSVMKGFAGRFPFIRIIENDRNCGLLFSINRALQEARCDYLVWTAADDRLLPNFVERNLECLRRWPEAGMTMSRLAVFPDGTDDVSVFTEKTQGPAFDFGGAPQFFTRERLMERLETSYLWMSANTVVARRQYLLDAGGFDEKLRWHADWFGFWVVGLRHGVCVIPEALALMRQRQATYSSAIVNKPAEQAKVLDHLASILCHRDLSDIGRIFATCPSMLSVFGSHIFPALLRRPARWRMASSYGLWYARHVWNAKYRWRIAAALQRTRVVTSTKVAALRSKLLRRLLKNVRQLKITHPGLPYRSGRQAEMAAALSGKFTLLVPTYNRPEDLRRLLTYMKRGGSQFRVVVLDSSGQESALAENRILAQKLGPPFEHRTFEPSTAPFSKFCAGLDMVETPYCGLCADDDLIFTDSFPALVAALEKNPAAVAAHGRCVGFSFADKIVNSGIMVSSGPSVTGPDGLRRIAKLLRRYEALTYAVHRTPVLRSAFAASNQMHSNLFAELAGSCISLAFGDALRLEEITHARSFMPSHPYRYWHPTEYIYPDPSRMVSDYVPFRSALINALKISPSATDAVTLDLMMLRYCVPYLTPTVMRNFIDAALNKWPDRIAIEGAWDALYKPSSVAKRQSNIFGNGSQIYKYDAFRRWKLFCFVLIKKHPAFGYMRRVGSRLQRLMVMALHPFETYSGLLAGLKRNPWLRRVPLLRRAWRVTRPVRRDLIRLVQLGFVHLKRRGTVVAGVFQSESSPLQVHEVALSNGWRAVFSRELVDTNGLDRNNIVRVAREFDAYLAVDASVDRFEIDEL